MALFKKILIANRGEIACRVIKTCKRLGIKTVAVYSTADRDSLHVRLADEAVAIGPAPSADSYLVIDRILQACKDTGAQAVHPGFGFLSENATFVAALEKAKIAFIGPPSPAIEAMGDKITSKKLAQDAGVSTVPGHMGLIKDAEEAVKIAKKIGFPVMIKASAGGGGKGMRVANTEAEAKEGFRSAQNEARSSFGDERIFIEKFVEEPRHIEIQVLADKKGATLYLGERECSIQRRHQKVIEEAPSPFLDAKTRKAMGEQAVALAKAVKYFSAGTVEFIVDKNRNFYFLEMNTRIQVEHPVTEMITGLDIVEWMIRIAAGEKLSFAQKDVVLDGWAMECRLYAEDPLRNFLPSIGRLTSYREPPAQDGVRVDSGVVEGSDITMYYDPMIAKLVTHAPDRAGAIAKMRTALDSFVVRGIRHNGAFLNAIMGQARFQSGEITTNYIAEVFPGGFSGAHENVAEERAIVLAAALLARRSQHPNEEEVPAERWAVSFNGTIKEVGISPHAGGRKVKADLDGKTTTAHLEWRPGLALARLELDGVFHAIQVARKGLRWLISYRGHEEDLLVMPAHVAPFAALMPVKKAPDMSKFLLSPMPGLLVSLAVEEGQDVKAGEEVAVVEAMKMENILRASRDGKVEKIHATAGSSLSVDQIIVEFS